MRELQQRRMLYDAKLLLYYRKFRLSCRGSEFRNASHLHEYTFNSCRKFINILATHKILIKTHYCCDCVFMPSWHSVKYSATHFIK